MSNPLPEPVYYQWRRKKMPWSLEFAFHHRCEATTDDSEVRTLHTADQLRAHAAAEVAALTAENARLRTVMVAAAEEIQAHWDAHCDAEGYGPANLMRRLEEGIPSQYGYTAGRFAELEAERDRLREELGQMQHQRDTARHDHKDCSEVVRNLKERDAFLLAATHDAQAYASKYGDEVLRLREELERARAVESAARAYAMSNLVDERDDPDLCYDDKHRAQVLALWEALDAMRKPG